MKPYYVNRLRERMRERNLTLDELHCQTGLAMSTLSNHTRGGTSQIGWETLAMLHGFFSQKYGYSFDELFKLIIPDNFFNAPETSSKETKNEE